jgi:xanthine dehydrogenase large subunit
VSLPGPEIAAAPDGAVGAPLPHDSAVRHVTGTAPYVDDLPEPAGLLHVAPGWCREATRGRIVSLDLDPVRAHPGVVAVLTAIDVPGVGDCSPSPLDRDPVFAEGEIRFHGQVVFAVVAETRTAARAAARRAVFVIEPRPPVVDVAAALERGDDVLDPYEFRKGDAAAAIAAAPLTFADRLVVGGQEHFYLEGQIALAEPGEGGEMPIRSSTQHPTEVSRVVARVLGRPEAAVVCECRRMGGGFGGKESQASQWAAIAALAAAVTGRPAKLRLGRDDDMVMTGKRHDFRVDWMVGFDGDGRIHGVEVDWMVGFDGDGRIHGVEVDFLARCGVSADLSQGVVDRTMFHADNAYHYPAAHIRSRRLRTDTVSATAFRGFGGPQGMLFAERMIDSIALRLGLDPLDVRRVNFYPPVEAEVHGVTPYGQEVDDCVIGRLVDELERTADHRARSAEIDAFNGSSPILRRGLALPPVKFGISFTLAHLNQAGAQVNVHSDGSITVNHGGTEMGQGLHVKVAQVVAEAFGVSVDRVGITATSTARVPNTGPTAASSGSDLNGMAAKIAAETIRDRMAEVAAERFGGEAAAVRFGGGVVRLGDRTIGFADLAEIAHRARVSLSATGFHATPGITWDRAAVRGRPFPYFAYGAACSEVEIDTLTGEMRVRRVDVLHDVGRSLNPAIDLGQIEGGFVQGMGWLTSEELVWDGDGRLASRAPATYAIPTAHDVRAISGCRRGPTTTIGEWPSIVRRRSANRR